MSSIESRICDLLEEMGWPRTRAGNMAGDWFGDEGPAQWIERCLDVEDRLHPNWIMIIDLINMAPSAQCLTSSLESVRTTKRYLIERNK